MSKWIAYEGWLQTEEQFQAARGYLLNPTQNALTEDQVARIRDEHNALDGIANPAALDEVLELAQLLINSIKYGGTNPPNAQISINSKRLRTALAALHATTAATPGTEARG